MIENQLKIFLDNNFNDDEKFALIRGNGLTAIMEKYYSVYPLRELANQMKNNNRVIDIVKQGQMIRLFRDFNCNNVPVLYFKGEILQKMLYKDITLRPAGDIDIYVSPDRFDVALSVLYNNGFVFRYTDTLYNNHHVQYDKGHMKLELHRNLFNPFTHINETYFFNHLVSYPYNDYDCFIFDETAMILHLFYHLYMDVILSNHVFVSNMKNNIDMATRFIFRSYEIAKCIFTFNTQIKWDEIVLDVMSQKLCSHFINMIRMIDFIFPNILPTDFLKAVYKKEYVTF